MASLLDLTKSNISYYTVPAALMLCLVPHAMQAILAGKNFDPALPSKTLERASKDESIDKATYNRIARAKAASTNGFETLGAYAAAVVAANVAGVPTYDVNALSLGYIASRTAFNFTYVVLQDNRKFAPLRSIIWNVSIGLIITLFIKAGNRS